MFHKGQKYIAPLFMAIVRVVSEEDLGISKQNFHRKPLATKVPVHVIKQIREQIREGGTSC